MQIPAVTVAVLLALGLPSDLTGQEDPDRWSVEVGLSLNGSGGNERLTVFTTELGLTHLQTQRYELAFRGRARYGHSEGAEVARSVRGSINAEIRPAAPWSPFLSATAEHDRVRRIDTRFNSGVGVKRTFWREGWSDLSLSGAVLYWYERLIVADTVAGPAPVSHQARWSWRGRARHQLREGTRVEQLVFFLPAWGQLPDYQVESQTTGRVALSQSLALTTSFLYQRDSMPVPEVGPDDWAITVGLSLATSW
jgi:hypothetical protein